MKIEDRIDEYVGKPIKKNIFYDDGVEYTYKSKSDLIRIIRQLYKDQKNIGPIADVIIRYNKKGKPQYIGANPYDSDVHGEDTLLGPYDSQKELDDEQDRQAWEI